MSNLPSRALATAPARSWFVKMYYPGDAFACGRGKKNPSLTPWTIRTRMTLAMFSTTMARPSSLNLDMESNKVMGETNWLEAFLALGT